MSLSLGRRRSLQQCAQADGTFAMLAMDQRGSLIRAINPSNPDDVYYEDVAALKRDVVSALSSMASAVLLDVEYGYPAAIASDSLSGSAGLLLAIEKSGYEGDPTARQTTLLEDWSVGQARRAGASGIKLLVYYRPDAPNAEDQEELVADVAADCRQWQIPLFLEPLHYTLNRGGGAVPNDERRRLVIETARRLVPLGVTVLKAEFPVDTKQTSDRNEWADACRELSDVCSVPWVLLSAGVDFGTYIEQVEVACANGASGVLCGRAVWQESVAMPQSDRLEFLHTTSADRFRRIKETVSATARPFTDFYPTESGDDYEDWYRR